MSVYNGERYLSEAIESILQQSFVDWELVIINDCSTDGSLAIIRKCLAQDQRVKLINNEQNFGLTKSLNIGLKLARGKYVARMDSDDMAYPKWLEKLLNYIKKKDIENSKRLLKEYFILKLRINPMKILPNKTLLIKGIPLCPKVVIPKK